MANLLDRLAETGRFTLRDQPPMPYDEALATRTANYFAARRVPHETKRMMGGLVFMVRGKMCVGVERRRLMARIDPAQQEAALRRPGCRPMDFTGRPMRGFVFVDAEQLRTDAALAAWLDLALAFNPSAKSSRPRPARKPVKPLLPFRENLRRTSPARSSAAAELGTLMNLGPKSSAWLAGIGIATRAQLEKLGPIETCRQLRRAGRPVSVVMAYAIEAGLAGCHWQAIPTETKNHLRAEFAKLRREEDAAAKSRLRCRR